MKACRDEWSASVDCKSDPRVNQRSSPGWRGRLGVVRQLVATFDPTQSATAGLTFWGACMREHSPVNRMCVNFNLTQQCLCCSIFPLVTHVSLTGLVTSGFEVCSFIVLFFRRVERQFSQLSCRRPAAPFPLPDCGILLHVPTVRSFYPHKITIGPRVLG